jgi:tRNA G10  N-methylase Trm11
MEYMIRFTQVHETFRLAEIKALAVFECIDLEVLSYSPSVSASSLTVRIFYSQIQVPILLCETII